jgi:O-antigen ligase
VAVSALSLLAAENLPAGQWALRILVIEPALLYLLVRIHRLYFRPTATDESLVASGQGVGLLHLADALVLGAVSVSVIGLGQYFFSDYVEAVEGVRRILSIYDSPNHLGLFLGRTIPLLIAAIAFAADRRRRIAYGLALLPVMAALYLTFSRGAWLVGLPAGLLTIGLLADGQRLLAGRRIRIAVLASLLVLVLALLALLPFVGTTRFASLFDLQTGTSFNRLLIWQGSLRLIAAHPLWGVGIGNFVTQYPRYMLPAAWREPVIYHAHDFVLDFWAMLGLPGLAALAWLLITFFRAALPAYRRLGESTAHVTDPDLKALTLGLIASMVNFMAHGLVDTGYFLTDLAFVFMLTLALGGRLAQAALTR